VTQVTEPGSGGDHVWTITPSVLPTGYQEQLPDSYLVLKTLAISNDGMGLTVVADAKLRKVLLCNGPSYGPINTTYDLRFNTYSQIYDSSYNVTEERSRARWRDEDFITTALGDNDQDTHVTHTYDSAGHVLTSQYTNNGPTNQHHHLLRPGEVLPEAHGDGRPGARHELRLLHEHRRQRGQPRAAQVGTRCPLCQTGQQYEYTYNEYGQKASETNLNDVVTTYAYDTTYGFLTQVVQDPGGLARTTTWRRTSPGGWK